MPEARTGLPTRPLGRTGERVSSVALGGLFINERIGSARDEAVRVVHRALELGVSYIDTAPMYGNSQEILGESLPAATPGVLIGTKCGRWNWQRGPYREVDAYKSQLEESLRHLRRDRVDLLYVHEADWAVFWADQEIPRSRRHLDPAARYDWEAAPVTRFLAWAREEGLARHIGISGNNAGLLARVLEESGLPIDVVLVAFQYSLIWRNAPERLLPVARERGVGVVLGAPLQQGKLAVPHPEWLEEPPEWMDEDLRGRFRALYEIQRESGLPLAELGLRYLLADPDVATVIPGAATVAELEANVRCALDGPLPRELHDRIGALGRVFPEHDD